MRVGIVGASGFVGNRATQVLHPDFEVRQIVHSSASLQRLILPNLDCPNLDCQIANSFDTSSLEAAFQGCDVIIHSVLGSSGLIRGCVGPTYRAAQKAGVRRIVYLSSMIVHSCAPAPGTTEETPLIENQPFPSHSAKIDAERKLLKLRQDGTVEVAIIRPGIVFGPRSRWIIDLADQLSHGTAYLIHGGQGICNTVYIDNLIEGIRLAMTAPEADGEAFFLGDREQVTWLDFYRPFADLFGIDPLQIPQVEVPEFTHHWRQQTIDTIWNSELIQKVLSLASEDLKQSLKNKVKQILPHRTQPIINSEPERLTQPKPRVTEMMAILQQSQYKLPFTKAEQRLGYQPIVSFPEGCRRSMEWLIGANLVHLPHPSKPEHQLQHD